jgi:hypothetical protein
VNNKAQEARKGNWCVERIGKADYYEIVLYEVDLLRFSYSKLAARPDGANEADDWLYLECFLLHYRNLLDFFGDPKPRKTDITLEKPGAVWSADSGLAGRQPKPKDLDEMRQKGLTLWQKYECGHRRVDTISRYLQHCTTYRVTSKLWHPKEMMNEIKELLTILERHLPAFKPATKSAVPSP